jgi:SNF2 family DNA or RNA helicase
MLVSLKAGGTGLNLVGADIVIHLDPWWNLAAENQASDRAHRIGQKRRVTIIKMVCKDTVEDKVLELQEIKRELASVVAEGDEALSRISLDDLRFLLN